MRDGNFFPTIPDESLTLLRKEFGRLERRVTKLAMTLERRNEQLRVFEDLATELQRELATLRNNQSDKRFPVRSPAASELG